MPLEKSITNSIIKYLNSLPETTAEKIFGNAQQKGRPDVGGCHKGQCLRIEVKTPDHGNKPTPLQEMNLRRWAKAGALCLTVWSLADVKALINAEERQDWANFHGTYYGGF